MSLSTVQLEVDIISVPINVDFDTRINVRKDFTFLRYSPNFPSDDIGLSFLGYDKINPITNLEIRDRTHLVSQNSPHLTTEEIKLLPTFTYSKGQFLLTDIFITDATGNDIPQYYRHDLSTLSFIPSNVELLDSSFTPLQNDKFVFYDETSTLGYNARYVYTNLRSTFDPIKNQFTVYYVRYKNSSTNESYVDLLDPKPIYEESLFSIDSRYRTYSIQEDFGSNEITVHFDTQNFSPTSLITFRVAIKSISLDRIFVHSPVFKNPDKKWNLRISNGEFFRNVLGTVTDLIIGTGDDIEDTFDLGKKLVSGASLIVYVGNVLQIFDVDFTLDPVSSMDETDQIVFVVPPPDGDDVTVSFTYDHHIARYYLPEFSEQVFSPVIPYKILIDHDAFVLDKRLIYVEPSTIADLEIDGFYITIIQRDISGTPVLAITNDPDADAYITSSGEITDVFFLTDAIQSISTEDGFIRLNIDLDTSLETSVTYRYNEKWLVYRDLEMNPALNTDLRNRTVVVYITPEISKQTVSGITTTAISRATHHLLLDETENIVEASQLATFEIFEGIAEAGDVSYLDDSTLGDTDYYTGFELEILSGPNLGRRLQIESYDTGLNRLTVALPFSSAITPGTSYRINKKFSSYSFTDPVTSTVFNYSGWQSVHLDYPDFFVILAYVKPITTIAIRNLELRDIRVQGGGLKGNNKKSSLSVQNEASWYWDMGFWDGRPYPGMASLLIELPRNVLPERGGSFSALQIRNIIHRHIADGYYPVLKFYDRSTQITHLEPRQGTLHVFWEDVSADSYNIYYGNNPENLDQSINVVGVTDYLITGLDNNKLYFIMIEAVINEDASYGSRLAAAIPYDLDNLPPGFLYNQEPYNQGIYTITGIPEVILVPNINSLYLNPGEYVDFGTNPDFAITDNVTLSYWQKIESQPGDFEAIFQRGIDNTSRGIDIFTYGPGLFAALFGEGSPDSFNTKMYRFSYTTGEWTHWVIVFSSGVMTTYKNRVIETPFDMIYDGTVDFLNTSDVHTSLGGNAMSGSGVSNNLDAKYKDMSLWNVALDQAGIDALATGGQPANIEQHPNVANCVQWVRLGDTVEDDATADTGIMLDSIGSLSGIPRNTEGDEIVADSP